MKVVISHIAIYVTDLARSTVFYRDVLGLPSLEEPFKIGMHSWFSLGPHCQLHLIAGAKTLSSFHINNHIALQTDAFDAIVLRLQDAGITYFDPFKNAGQIHTRPDGVQQIFFKDPDGYWLEINNESRKNENV